MDENVRTGVVDVDKQNTLECYLKTREEVGVEVRLTPGKDMRQICVLDQIECAGERKRVTGSLFFSTEGWNRGVGGEKQAQYADTNGASSSRPGGWSVNKHETDTQSNNSNDKQTKRQYSNAVARTVGSIHYC